MNPGYAGRSALPDNLKALFRPVAMVSPDARLIAQVLLYTLGFSHAEGLARRAGALFSACAEQLSRQGHYDWGLRALKTVLVAAGRVRRHGSAIAADREHDGSLATEAACLCQATLQTTLPKLVPEDIAPFRSLLAAAFPEAGNMNIEAAALEYALATVCDLRSLSFRPAPSASLHNQPAHERRIPSTPRHGSPSRDATHAPPGASAWPLFHPTDPVSAAAGVEAYAESEPPAVGEAPSAVAHAGPLNDWAAKVLQLYHCQAARHGVVLVGPPGSGKTAAWRALLDALTLVDGVRGEVHVVDAKALPGGKEQLYGRLDPATSEWVDGILPVVLRGVLANARGEASRRHWLVFDGDVDPDWAEALNSVLDDNRLLTLPSGERLPLPLNLRIVLETDSLRWATMATVSRVGMVCFSSEAVTPAMVAGRFVALLAAGELPETGASAPAVAADRALVAPRFISAASRSGESGGKGVVGAGHSDALGPAASETVSSHFCRALAHGLGTDLCGPGGVLLGTLDAIEKRNAPGALDAAGHSASAPIMPVSPAALTASVLALLTTGIHALASAATAAAAHAPGHHSYAAAAADVPALVSRGRQWAALSVAWALSAAFPNDARAGIASVVVTLAAAAGIALPPAITAAAPAAAGANAPLGLLDLSLNLETGSWQPWSSLMPPPQQPVAGGRAAGAPGGIAASAGAAGDGVIPTPDTVRLSAQVRNLLPLGRRPAGCPSLTPLSPAAPWLARVPQARHPLRPARLGQDDDPLGGPRRCGFRPGGQPRRRGRLRGRAPLILLCVEPRPAPARPGAALRVRADAVWRLGAAPAPALCWGHR